MNGLVRWLDEQIANAEGDRREVREHFPEGERPDDADLAYARERAFREVREYASSLPGVLTTGEPARAEDGRLHLPTISDDHCPDCGKVPGKWQPTVSARRSELTLEECRTCGAAWTGLSWSRIGRAKP